MQMLVASEEAARTESDGTQSKGLNRSLVRELKRLREESRKDKGMQNGGSGGATAQADLDASSEEETGGVPESEVVDGRIVFNVMVEHSAASAKVGAGDNSATDSSDDEGDEKVAGTDGAENVNAAEASARKSKKPLDDSRGGDLGSGRAPDAGAEPHQSGSHTDKTDRSESASSGRKTKKRRKSRNLAASHQAQGHGEAAASNVVCPPKSESNGVVIADTTTKDEGSGAGGEVSPITVGDSDVVGNPKNEVAGAKGGVTKTNKRRRKSLPVAIVDSEHVSPAVAVVDDEAGDAELAGHPVVAGKHLVEVPEGHVEAGDAKSDAVAEPRVTSTASARKRSKKTRRKSTISELRAD